MVNPLVVYVDVDDTLVRSAGSKVIAISGVVEHVRRLKGEGATLYCWSSGGGEYAKVVAEQLGLAECFDGFLPKPHVLLDDQPIEAWRRLLQIHPMQCGAASTAVYLERLSSARTR